MWEPVVVMLAGFVMGGWAIPLGLLLGLSPFATFLSAATGGLVGCWAFLLAGDRITTLLSRRRGVAAGGHGDVAATDERRELSRIRRFVDRYGARGLGIVGPIFPGVTASIVGGLALGLERRSFGTWLSIGIVVMYGSYALVAAGIDALL